MSSQHALCGVCSAHIDRKDTFVELVLLPPPGSWEIFFSFWKVDFMELERWHLLLFQRPRFYFLDPTWWFTGICHSSPRGSGCPLLWPLQAPSTHAMRIHTCRPTHIKKNLIIFLKILCVLSLEEDIRYPGSEVIGGWKPSVGSRSWTWALHKNSKYS